MGSSRSKEFADDEAEEEDEEGESYFTPVDENLFTAPLAMSMSGGTAAFFSLACTTSVGPLGERCSPGYWLGKDLERARDEIDFYEDIKHLDRSAYKLLHRWSFRYAGVLKARCKVYDHNDTEVLEEDPRELLVLENLRDGKKSLRLLDIKIGEVTAVAGFKKKSWLAAFRQKCLIDDHTNSRWAGFRLEGFDNPPLTLKSQLEGSDGGCCQEIGKKHKRLILQRLSGKDFLRHFDDVADFHEEPAETEVRRPRLPTEYKFDKLLTPVEYSEALLFDVVQKLAALCNDTCAVPVPQMWVGSSLAITCDGERLPAKMGIEDVLTMDAADPNSKGLAKTYVFDWGRSELNTPEMYENMTESERELRSQYWQFWRRGVLRVLYDAGNLYMTKFAAFPLESCTLLIEVWDYDTVDPSDLVGSVEIPLEPSDGVLTVDVKFWWGLGYLTGKVNLEIFRQPQPANSRLDNEAWRVVVKSVEGLPCTTDTFSKSDPMIECCIVNPDGIAACRALTQVVWNQDDAILDHHLDFAQAKPEVVDDLLARVSRQFGAPVERWMFENGFEEFLGAIPQFNELAREE